MHTWNNMAEKFSISLGFEPYTFGDEKIALSTQPNQPQAKKNEKLDNKMFKICQMEPFFKTL